MVIDCIYNIKNKYQFFVNIFLFCNMMNLNDEILIELDIDVKKRINLYTNDNDYNYNWFEIKYQLNVDIVKFYIKINYDDNFFKLKSYKPEKTLPYNYDVIEKNNSYYVDSEINIYDYKNFYIEINKNINSKFIENITIEIITQSNYVIKKNIFVYFNPLSKINEIVTYNDKNNKLSDEMQQFMYNSINFDNLVISDILYLKSIIATLQYNNINVEKIQFAQNNQYFDLLTQNGQIKLILKYPLIEYKDDNLLLTINTSYSYNNHTYSFDKLFNFKINKYYIPLTLTDQNYFSYVGDSCWLQYYSTKLLPNTIKLFKLNAHNNYELIESDLPASFFIPKESGTYRLLIYNYFDKIESSKYIVENKPLMQTFIENFIGFCKSNQ